MNRILIIQLGDIGDVVWAIPSFQACKKTYPQAELSVLTRKPNGDLILDDPDIDHALQMDKDNLWNSVKLLLRLHQNKYDLVIDLRSDDRGAYASFITCAPVRIALYYPNLPWRNRLFTHLVEEPVKEERISTAAGQSLQILHGIGIKEETRIPHIFTTTELKNKIKELLAAEKIETKPGWISINPFSRWPYKEWDKEKWMQLASWLWQKYEMPVIIIGSEAEHKRAADMVKISASPVYNFAGKTTLREMAALLQMSRLHIGVDSAAPHIAAAVGTPTLTIYGPTDWRDWAPQGEKNKVVLSDMSCAPCHEKGCEGKGRSLCLENLTADKVISAAAEMLRK